MTTNDTRDAVLSDEQLDRFRGFANRYTPIDRTDLFVLLDHIDAIAAERDRLREAVIAWIGWESHRYGCAGCRSKKEPTICPGGEPLWAHAMAVTSAALAADDAEHEGRSQ